MTAVALPKFEIILYFSVWISAFIYATYNVYLAGKFFDMSVPSNSFIDSWFEYKKDVTNQEWRHWMIYILSVLPKWVGIHLVLTQLTRWLKPLYIPALHCLITTSFIYVHFGPECAVFTLLHVIFYYLILQLKSIALVWILGLPFAIIFCYAAHQFWAYMGKEPFSYILFVVSSMWQHLRCTSFILDQLSSEKKTGGKLCLRTLYDLLGYCFYFPTYFVGPFIIYSNFGPYMYQPFKKLSIHRTGTFLFNLLRFLFWAAVVEASLHFLYIHALQQHLVKVSKLGNWTLGGLGLLLGVFFNMKLIVLYGLGITFANFDGYMAPPPPKCGLHLHLYSDIWRVFDVGYYQFIHKYVYRPLCGDRREWNRRLLASTVCFSFVFFWHGIHSFVLYWSFLNWLVVSVVAFGTIFSKSASYRNWEKRNLSETNSRRLEALIATPTLMVGSIASSYFFAGVEAGNIFFKEAFINSTWTAFTTGFFICYCVCQVSIETKNWEKRKTMKMKHN